MANPVALKTVIENDGREPIPKYVMNPYTGRSIRTDSNKNRKLLNLPLLPRKERADKGKPRGPYKRKRKVAEEEPVPEVRIAEDKESETMINELIKEARTEESDSDSDMTEPEEAQAPEEEDGGDYIDVESMRDEVPKPYMPPKRVSQIQGIVFPEDYSQMYRKLTSEALRGHSK